MITVSDNAKEYIHEMMQTEGKAETSLVRVGVKGGGCSGMTYILGFDQQGENDQEFTVDGISCIMDKTHAIYLHGMHIDWQDGLNNRGFTFKNPNASSTCGCGTSFAV